MAVGVGHRETRINDLTLDALNETPDVCIDVVVFCFEHRVVRVIERNDLISAPCIAGLED